MKPSAYLDAVKAQLGVTSDYELAKRLEINNGRVAEYRAEARPIPLDVAFKIAITLQLDPAQVVADLECQREKNPKKQAFWRGFLQRATLGAVILACTLALSFSGISGNEAATHGGLRRRPNFA